MLGAQHGRDPALCLVWKIRLESYEPDYPGLIQQMMYFNLVTILGRQNAIMGIGTNGNVTSLIRTFEFELDAFNLNR